MRCHTFSLSRSVYGPKVGHMQYSMQCFSVLTRFLITKQSNMILLSAVSLTENKVRTGLMCHFDELVDSPPFH